jgi:valyl-tRNA synthetase
MGEVPFSQVLLNGIVRDAKGRKLSKSLGNSPDPLDLIAKHGADAVRFSTVMLSPPGQDTFFDAKNVETGQHFANKIWNAARLVLGSAEQKGFVAELGLEGGPADAARRAGDTPVSPGVHAADSDFHAALSKLWHETFARPLPPAVLAGLRLEDRWILHRYTDAVAAVQRDLESLRANEAATDLYHFFWDEYCAWYLESIKPRLQGDDRDTARSAHAVALVLLASAGKLLAPLLPFLAEELWSRIPGTAGLVTTSRYPRELPGLRHAPSLDRFSLVIEAASAIRTVRAERNVPPGKKAPALVQKESAEAVGWTREQAALLVLHAKLAGLETTDARPADAISVLERGLQIYLPLGGLVDLEAERERLQRELERAERDLVALDAKLANPGFVDKAPAPVVDGERARRGDLVGRRDRLRHDLAALTGKGR